MPTQTTTLPDAFGPFHCVLVREGRPARDPDGRKYTQLECAAEQARFLFLQNEHIDEVLVVDGLGREVQW